MESQLSLKTQMTAVLGSGFEELNTNPTLKTTGSVQSFFNFNPLRASKGDKGNQAEKTDDDDDDDDDEGETIASSLSSRPL